MQYFLGILFWKRKHNGYSILRSRWDNFGSSLKQSNNYSFWNWYHWCQSTRFSGSSGVQQLCAKHMFQKKKTPTYIFWSLERYPKDKGNFFANAVTTVTADDLSYRFDQHRSTSAHVVSPLYQVLCMCVYAEKDTNTLSTFSFLKCLFSPTPVIQITGECPSR